jgi:P pilus assembly chaperone PapD
MRTSVSRLARTGRALAFIAPLMLLAPAARAELVLSQLVVDLAKPTEARADIEVWNNSDERSYLVAEPSEIVNAGTSGEQRRIERDPEQRGLLVSPARMILEPGQRKLIRLAAIGPRAPRERVYRLTVKPVAGELSSSETGLKLLVGYDVLVLLRPADVRTSVSAVRSGSEITFRNDGNASIELIDGKQCTAGKTNCAALPGKRLYAGASWSQPLSSSAPVEYTLVSNGQSSRKTY